MITIQDRASLATPALKFLTLGIVGLAWLALGPSPASAQFDRYELGRRVREFEVEWDRVPDPAARAKACQSLKAAVNSFFSFRLPDAARSIGEARFALRGPAAVTEGERWAESLCLKPDSRLIDAGLASMPVTVALFYPTDAKMPAGATIRLRLGDSPGSRVEAPLGPLPMALTLPIAGVEPGDHALVGEIRLGEKALMRASMTISVANDLDDRLLALGKIIMGWPEDAESATTDRESVRGQLRRLESLAAKITLESDFPANRILRNVEEQAQLADQSEPYLGKDRAGQSWATVVTASGYRVAVRLFIPEVAAKGDPLPIVVALHGAGGSENMFFESYGHGAIVDRCRERGWLLVAPRSTAIAAAPVAEVVDALAKIYPVDLARVMLVGHSMGAGQAVASASREPDRYAAVVALGGGGSVRPSPGIKRLPFFVGVGSEDFAVKGSKDLADALKKAEVGSLLFREYPGIEHLGIVQVALPDVFRFFDDRAKPR